MSAETASETLFSFIAGARSAQPVYGIFDGDVLVDWTTSLRKAREGADCWSNTYKFIGRTRAVRP